MSGWKREIVCGIRTEYSGGEFQSVYYQLRQYDCQDYESEQPFPSETTPYSSQFQAEQKYEWEKLQIIY